MAVTRKKKTAPSSARKKPLNERQIIGFMFGVGLVLSMFLGFLLFALDQLHIPGIRDVSQYSPPQATLILDRQGNIVDRVAAENRIVIGLDKMPPLLKDIGEAYYRWQPKSRPGSDRMEEALVAWLKETMQDAGIANTIEVVQPGERFDSTRHTASTRGVEITEVHGWVVLRDNGKVYTKASVAVR